MRRRNHRNFVLLSAPAVVWFTAFMLVPLVFMFWVSLLDWRGIVEPWNFAGLDNYVRLIFDTRFHAALLHTTLLVTIALPIALMLGFMLAFFLVQRPPGLRMMRVLFFAPAMLSVAAQSMLFVGLYLPGGVVNTLLRNLGLESLTRVWLANVTTALPALGAIYVWAATGWASILFYASLSNIPDEIFEMARVEGAGYWTRMWKIAFPLNLDFFGVIFMLEFVFMLLGFAQIVILLTMGGPGSATLTLGYELYAQAFKIRNLGYSQAIGVFTFAVGMAGMLLIRTMTRRDY